MHGSLGGPCLFCGRTMRSAEHVDVERATNWCASQGSQCRGGVRCVMQNACLSQKWPNTGNSWHKYLVAWRAARPSGYTDAPNGAPDHFIERSRARRTSSRTRGPMVATITPTPSALGCSKSSCRYFCAAS